ncbi:MAG: hypothetical protein JRC60_00515 [Deltaproteobacteria bacterium]|nr:hypothetical protein [Deltaproteobacteria bacterium]
MLEESRSLEERKGYQWPASSITDHEMKVLAQLRKKTGCSISELLRQSVEMVGRMAQEKGAI